MEADDPSPSALAPTKVTDLRVPTLPGWQFVDVSLRQGKLAYALDPSLRRQTVYLGPGADLAGTRFVQGVEDQVRNARRGVFLWNLESYEDVAPAPGDFRPPVTTLYAVASGFKPNAILRSHGFDEHTRVVFFDYGKNALAVKRTLREEWDGWDYPRYYVCYNVLTEPQVLLDRLDGRPGAVVWWSNASSRCTATGSTR